ncbi:MAG: hypothetical protein ACERLB_10200 [Gammaproteobacteria bacterium]
MTDKKTSTDDDKKQPEPEIDGLITLFSSDNTELTDFTEKVNRAILGDGQEQQDLAAQANQAKDKSSKKPTLISSAKNNVVNLFGPK